MAALNLFDLTGKKAVIVGGAGGIGQAIAQGIADAGADILISSRKEEALQRAKAEIKEAIGKDAEYAICDASDEAQVEELLKTAIEKLGRVDILVNAQGYNKPFPTLEFPVEEFDKLFAANVRSLMLTCKHFGKYMQDNGIRGKIVNLSSVRGARAVGNGGPTQMGYCTSKGAVDMLTRSFASSLGPDVQVNAIGPTLTYTPMMVGRLPDDEGERNKMAAAMPAKRIGYPEDCVGPAVFLASAASDFVTGQIIYPDGGLTAVG